MPEAPPDPALLIEPPTRKRRSKSVQATRRPKQKSAVPGKTAPEYAPAEPVSTATADELDMLETENRRLKGLLIEQLRLENITLKTMLGRFA